MNFFQTWTFWNSWNLFCWNRWTFFQFMIFVEISCPFFKFVPFFQNQCNFFKNVIIYLFENRWKYSNSCILYQNRWVFPNSWTFFKSHDFFLPVNVFQIAIFFESCELFLSSWTFWVHEFVYLWTFSNSDFFRACETFFELLIFFQIFTLVNCKRTNETYNAKKSSRANFDQGLDAQNPSSSHSLLSSHVAKTPQHHYTTVSREIAVGENRRKKRETETRLVCSDVWADFARSGWAAIFCLGTNWIGCTDVWGGYGDSGCRCSSFFLFSYVSIWFGLLYVNGLLVVWGSQFFRFEPKPNPTSQQRQQRRRGEFDRSMIDYMDVGARKEREETEDACGEEAMETEEVYISPLSYLKNVRFCHAACHLFHT